MKSVYLYTWSTCPFCIAAVNILSQKSIAFDNRAIDGDAEGWAQMQSETHGANTVPQIFIEGTLIGGFSELRALEERGELDTLLGL